MAGQDGRDQVVFQEMGEGRGPAVGRVGAEGCQPRRRWVLVDQAAAGQSVFDQHAATVLGAQLAEAGIGHKPRLKQVAADQHHRWSQAGQETDGGHQIVDSQADGAHRLRCQKGLQRLDDAGQVEVVGTEVGMLEGAQVEALPAEVAAALGDLGQEMAGLEGVAGGAGEAPETGTDADPFAGLTEPGQGPSKGPFGGPGTVGIGDMDMVYPGLEGGFERGFEIAGG